MLSLTSRKLSRAAAATALAAVIFGVVSTLTASAEPFCAPGCWPYWDRTLDRWLCHCVEKTGAALGASGVTKPGSATFREQVLHRCAKDCADQKEAPHIYLAGPRF